MRVLRATAAGTVAAWRSADALLPCGPGAVRELGAKVITCAMLDEQREIWCTCTARTSR
ncbi:hypothetical protein [Kutzneria kofuensis]|uniref:hypothetical protein n=1 Tax=Kutzneria kofuensis TaxID=103725 RepID=UPI0031EB8D79